VGIFKVHETLGASMVVQLKDLLVRYNLLDKVIAYVKDDKTSLSTLTTAFTSIISCVPLLLLQPYVANCCYGHAMSKCCQYVINDLKMCVGMKEVSIKETQSSL
jgi:hypothetical protein